MKILFVLLILSVGSSAVSANVLTDRYLAKKRVPALVEDTKETDEHKEPLLDAELIKEYSEKIKKNYWADKDGASLMKNKALHGKETSEPVSESNMDNEARAANPLYLAILKSKNHEKANNKNKPAEVETVKAILGQDMNADDNKSIKIGDQLIDLTLLGKSWVKTEKENFVLSEKYKLNKSVPDVNSTFEGLANSIVKGGEFSCEGTNLGYVKCLSVSNKKMVLVTLEESVLTLYYK